MDVGSEFPGQTHVAVRVEMTSWSGEFSPMLNRGKLPGICLLAEERQSWRIQENLGSAVATWSQWGHFLVRLGVS